VIGTRVDSREKQGLKNEKRNVLSQLIFLSEELPSTSTTHHTKYKLTYVLRKVPGMDVLVLYL